MNAVMILRHNRVPTQYTTSTINSIDPNLVHIAVVSCGKDRAIESLNMIKSAIIFQISNQKRVRLKFIVITEDNLMQIYREKVFIESRINYNSFYFQNLTYIF
jgi:UDP-xylose:glucoside alpha-1,3-xylosyltransferase